MQFQNYILPPVLLVGFGVFSVMLIVIGSHIAKKKAKMVRGE